jgi:7-keto-8-aminopelargonate synthetase-like enzyme
MKFIKRMIRSRTFWVSLSGACGAVGAYCAGEMELQPMLMSVGGCLIAIFLRDGMERK